MRAMLPFIAATMACVLTSCGGGDGGSGSTASPTNRAPVFTSAMTASILENSAGSFYAAKATDADGDIVQYAIAGGADAAFFQLSGNNLSFVNSPNFDRFADADQDNIFEIALRASDARGGAAEQTVRVTVDNDAEGVSMRRLATGFNDPVGITSWISSDYTGQARLLVAERDGTIWSLNAETGERSVWTDLNLPAGREVLDIAGYSAGGIVKDPVVLIRDSTGISLLRLGYEPPIETKIAEGNPQGAGGTLAYTNNSELGGQGLLVIALGDPGGQRAQDSTGYGNVYVIRRLDPETVRDRLFQVGRGLQQPSRIFDFLEGVLIADVGQNFQHEFSPLVSRDLVNFGWPFFEGTVEVNAGASGSLVEPSFVYPLGTDVFSGTGIRGGLYYYSNDGFENSLVESLNDRILFADAAGSIFTVGLDFDPASFENRTLDFVPDTGTIDSIVTFAETFERVLFILDADGEVFRLDPA